MSRPITDTLRHLRGGVFLDEASDALAELVQAVSDTGRPGTLTVSLTLKRASRGSGALVIADKITVKGPKEDAVETMLYATPEGALVAEDPRQHKLALKDVREAIPEPTQLKTPAVGTT
jgi:hypothetical protein